MAKDPLAIPTFDPQKEILKGLPKELRAAYGGSSGAPGADNRRKPRITIEELNTKGIAAVKEKWPELEAGQAFKENAPDNRSAIEKVFDWIDLPRNIVGNIIGSIAGVDKSKLSRGALGLKRVAMSDVLEKMGIQNKVARAVVGFVGDIAIDPLTYLSAGSMTGAKVAAGVPKLLPAGMKTLEAAIRTGRVPTMIANAVGGSIAGMKKPLEVALAIAKNVARGDEVGQAARAFFKEFGVQGRHLLRVPFTQIKTPALGIGKQARVFKAMDVSAEGVQALQNIEKALAAAKDAKTAAAYHTAQKAIADRDITTLTKTFKEATTHLADLKRQYKVLAKAVHATGARATRSPVPSGAVRDLQRKIDLAEGMLDWMRQKGRMFEGPGATEPWLAEGGKIAGEMRRGLAQSPLPLDEAVRPMAQFPARGDIGAKSKTLAGLRRQMRSQPTYQVLPPELQAAQGQIGRGRVTVAGTEAALGKAKQTSLLERKQIEKAAGQLEKAHGEFLNARSAAPDVYRLAEEAQLGKGYQQQLNPIKFVLNKLFGQPYGSTPMRQRELAQIYRATLGAKTNADKAALALVKDVDDFARNLVGQGLAKTEDEARQLIGMTLDIGTGANLSKLSQSDAGKAFWAQTGQQIANSPQYGALKGKLDEMMGGWLQTERGAGMKVAETELGAFHRSLNPKLNKYARNQKWLTGGTGGVGGGAGQPFMDARVRAFEIVKKIRDPETGEIQKVADILYAAPDEAKTLAAAQDAKLTGKSYAVSAAQHQQMYESGKYTHLFGKDTVDRTKIPTMFDMDPVNSVAGRAFQHERAIASAEMQKLTNQYGIVANAVANDQLSKAGYRVVDPLTPDNPLYSIMGDASPYGSTGRKMAYPLPVADMLERYRETFQSSKAVESLLKPTDMLLGWFKRWALFHPGYVIRNVWQNAFGTLMAGGPKAVMKQAVYATSAPVRKILKAIGANNIASLGDETMTLGGKVVRLQDLANDFAKLNVAGADRSIAEFTSGVLRGGGPARGATKKAVQMGVAGSEVVRKYNQALEESMRIGTLMAFMDEGLDAEQAMMRTVLAMPDLSNVTQFEKTALARILPWARWFRNNAGLQMFYFLPQQPAWMASVGKLKNFIEGASSAWRGDTESVPEELRPEWQREMQAPQILGDRNQGQSFMLRSFFPFEEAQQTMAGAISPGQAAKYLVGQTRPGIKFMAEAATGRDIFRGAPLKTPDTVEAIQAIPQALMGSSGTAMDNLLAVRPLREYGRRVWEQPTAGGQAVRGIFGGVAQNIDAQQGLQSLDIKTQQQMYELRRLIARAKENKDTVEEKRLLQLFMMVQAERMRLGLSVSKNTQQVMPNIEQSYPWIDQTSTK